MPSPFLTYHPGARVVTGLERPEQAKPARCTYHQTGGFCAGECSRCAERIVTRQIAVTQAVRRSIQAQMRLRPHTGASS